MKKAAACVILAAVLLRLAVLAGAGDALASWVRELDVDQRLVASAVKLELGTPEEQAEVFAPATPSPVSAPPRVTPAAVEALPLGEKSPEPEPAAEPEPEVRPLGTAIAGGVSVHNRTAFDVDPAALAAEGLNLTLPAGQPQILIIHTHSSEAYSQDPYDPYEPSDPYRTEDKGHSVIRVGDVLAEKFESYGLTVLHDRELYDYPSYTGSYNRSGAAVQEYLNAYPSIRIVIDLHRDAIGSGDVVYKTQATLDGRSSAQVMILVGSGENGLYHPYWRENLKLALYMQGAVEARWPTLARPIELVKERYNQHLTTGSMILEVGSTGNTLGEALTAISLFGDTVGPALAELIQA